MISLLPYNVYSIHGHLSAAESDLLYRMAAGVPAEGRIVEIGSFQGKSTVCLGLGAKQSGARVYAIDPHEDCQVSAITHYGMENHAALLKNLIDFEVADVVRLIGLPSVETCEAWHWLIHLLWIDGSHEYADVINDLTWATHVHPDGLIAMHDSSGHYPGVTRALGVFLETCPEWRVVKRVDAITVLKREA